MESTFRIEGPSGQGKTIGTVFIMGRPMSEQGKLRYVLITAAHVLEEVNGDVATLYLRRKVNETDWALVPNPVPIRANGRQLWIRHPSADVAVMYIGIPDDVAIPLISTDLLIADKELSDLEIHAGDALNVLGFPLGLSSNDAGFPILRSGRIASYPLLPTDKTKTFLLDFVVFKGNSGGLVYLVDSTRVYHGSPHWGTINFIAGLVSQEISMTENLVGLYSETHQQLPLGLAVIVHASLIKQAINMLQSPDTVPK